LPVSRLQLLSAASEAEQLAETNDRTANIDLFQLSAPIGRIPECQHQISMSL
jgi:hypothetical protein